jgi:hypothetical protein
MRLIDEPINLSVCNHFIGTKMNANYATEAGSAKNASYASAAGNATTADSAKLANQAVNATYAQVSKEAERLNLGGTMIYIDPSNRYIIFTAPNMDINKSLMIDVVNRNILNVNLIADINGNQICPAQEE